MGKFNVNEIVKFTDENDCLNDTDRAGFVVLISEPDPSGCIIVQNIANNEYFGLPENRLSLVRVIRGKFYRTVSGITKFAVENPFLAAKLSFIANGSINNPETMKNFDRFVSDIVAVEVF
jgi:hypothetical protein